MRNIWKRGNKTRQRIDSNKEEQSESEEGEEREGKEERKNKHILRHSQGRTR